MPNTATAEVPYSYYLSKNAARGLSKRGMYMRSESRAALNTIEQQLSGTGPWYEGKIWVDIHVEMPSKKSDAINVLDLVADGVKRGIGVDDHWFAATIDWSIKRDNPIVTVTVRQDVDEHMRYCSKCAQLLPLTTGLFYRSKNKLLGYNHICRECSRAETKRRKQV